MQYVVSLQQSLQKKIKTYSKGKKICGFLELGGGKDE